MKRSRVVQLTLVTTVSSLLLSCDGRPTRYCVDENWNVADDKNCSDHNRAGVLYHWHYGGTRGPVSNGTHLTSGTDSEPSGGYQSRTESGSSERGVVGEAGEHASGGGHGEGGGGE